MKHVLLPVLQKALNRYLALDPESAVRLRALRGKVVTIELKIFPPLIFSLLFKDNEIEILSDLSEQPDLIIRGMPLSLLRLSVSDDKRKHFFGDDVTLEGNLELGQQVTDLFDQLEIDWEEYASRWVGDVSAHQLGRVVRDVKNFAERLRESLSRNINEYVHEEAELFPSEEALQDFFADVDTLRMDVDRLEARIENLKRGCE